MHHVTVGERIRQLRLGLVLSVRTLAATTGCSPSLITQAERRRVTPSVGSLERIAMALGVSLGTLFAEPEPPPSQPVRAHARCHVVSTWSPVSIEALRPTDGVGTLEPLLITMATGGGSGTFPTAPVGEKFAFVLQGEVTPTLGDEAHRLGPGDAITFAAAVPHQLENTSPAPEHVLAVSVRGWS